MPPMPVRLEVQAAMRAIATRHEAGEMTNAEALAEADRLADRLGPIWGEAVKLALRVRVVERSPAQ
jgi:hypothetical protein